MSREPLVTKVTCTDCPYFIELSHEIRGSIDARLKSAGWLVEQSSDTGLTYDFCPRCAEKRKKKIG